MSGITVHVFDTAADIPNYGKGYIVTHKFSDMDSIVSAWLMYIVGGRKHKIALVTTDITADMVRKAFAVVDVGKVYNTWRNLFDHHLVLKHFFNKLGQDFHSATSLVFDAYHKQLKLPESFVSFLKTVNAVDNGRNDFNGYNSRMSGLHGLLTAYKERETSEQEIYTIFDGILTAMLQGYGIEAILGYYSAVMAEHSRRMQEYINMATTRRKYTGAEGRIVATVDAHRETTKYLLDMTNCEIVVFTDTETNSIGIMRKTGMSLNLGELIKEIRNHIESMENPSNLLQLFYNETSNWFLHPLGFFVGLNGKSDKVRLTNLSAVHIAKVIEWYYY